MIVSIICAAQTIYQMHKLYDAETLEWHTASANLWSMMSQMKDVQLLGLE